MISIIIPIFNVEKYLNRCIDSILAQTFSDYVLVLVDDGSPDKCGEICDKYAAQDKRIHVIHKENGGLSDARNAGIEWTLNNTNCRWITFVDSDDWVHPEYLSILLQPLVQNDCEVSCCIYERCSSFNGFPETNIQQTIYSGENFCVDQYHWSQTATLKLYKTDHFKTLRYPVGKIHEDAFTIYQILLKCKRIAFLDGTPLYYYYTTENSITLAEWTPVRLDLLEAFEKKIEYSQVNGFYDYLNVQLEDYIGSIVWCIRSAKNKYSYLIPGLRVKLRKALRLAHKYGLFPFGKCDWSYYELAYPRLMKIYWDIKGVTNKVKKVFNR